jgi:conjugal transfer pilin signal peptidase TrbI
MRAADLPTGPRAWPRLALWGGLGAAALALSTLSAFARDHALMINASPSLPYWAVWLTRGAVPERGDIILFDPPASKLLERHFGKEPKPFGKRVSGVPGDLVTEKDRAFFVNGRLVARAKLSTRLGEPLALGPTGRVPRGCYFVTTEHKDGFDSRYAAIGWICRPRILGVGRSIL